MSVAARAEEDFPRKRSKEFLPGRIFVFEESRWEVMPCDSKPRPLVGIPSGRAPEVLLSLGRQAKVTDTALPEIDEVAGVGDGEIDGLAVIRMSWLTVEKLDQLAAALPPIADAGLPRRVGIGARGCEGGPGTARPCR